MSTLAEWKVSGVSGKKSKCVGKNLDATNDREVGITLKLSNLTNHYLAELNISRWINKLQPS